MSDFLCFFKAKREEIKNNNFWKNKTDFSHTNFFLTKRSETENVVFPTFFQESNNLFFNFGYIKMESRRESELKRRLKKRRVNEKTFFRDTEKEKTWNMNQCKKKLNKKGNRENGVFF